jgi:hypothetical protein
MKTLGRVFFLLLSIVTGLWLAFSAFIVYASLKRPDAVAGALGGALVPLLIFIVCVWCFCSVAPSKPTKAE